MPIFSEALNFSIVQTELDTVFYQKFNYPGAVPGFASAQTASIFKPVNTEHAAYIESVFKGSGLFPVVGESQNVPLSTPRVTNKMTILVKDFASGIEISKDLFDDNLHGVWAKTVADFAQKALITQDANAFALFNGAFTTTLTADGVSFINSAHPLIGGGTQSNLATGALNDTNLNLAMVSLQTQKDQSGVVMGNMPSILLVPPALLKQAHVVTDSALQSGGAQNDINVYRSMYGFVVWCSAYLSAAAGGSDTAWFLLSDNHSVSRLIRQGVQTNLRDWGMSNNRTYFYQANFREAAYVVDYVGAVGSAG